jgi:hypothetical protein
MYARKRELKTWKNTLKPWLMAGFCLLLLGILLLVTACSNNYQNPPGSPPNNGTPQATPTSGGYSLIYHIDKETQALLVPYR